MCVMDFVSSREITLILISKSAIHCVFQVGTLSFYVKILLYLSTVSVTKFI